MSNLNRQQLSDQSPAALAANMTPEHAARALVIEHLRPQLTGRHWLQLSQANNPLLRSSGSLLLETIDCNAAGDADSDRRITTLSPHSIEGIICDDVLQLHPQPERVAKEIQTLIRAGGWIVICGHRASKHRLTPLQVTRLFKHSSIKLKQCYSYRNQPLRYHWQTRLSQLQLSLTTQLSEQLPTLLPALCGHASTQAGWVMLFKEQSLATTPLARPLKLGRNKLQINNAVCIRSNHWRDLDKGTSSRDLAAVCNKAA